MTSLTKAELEKLVGLSLASMKYLIRMWGSTIEAQDLMGELTREKVYSFQLIDKILQLAIAETFISKVLDKKSEKLLDDEDTSDRIKVEGNKMTTCETTICKALVPVKAMDTQALAVINQIDKPTHQRAMASIRATTDCICIEGALSILDALGYRKDIFHIKGQKWQICDLKNERYFPDLQGRTAYETPVFWFWGGPPTKLKWYKGTLQTLLDDRVLYEIGRQGADKIAELIGTDLEGIANVSTLANAAIY